MQCNTASKSLMNYNKVSLNQVFVSTGSTEDIEEIEKMDIVPNLDRNESLNGPNRVSEKCL